MRLTEQQYNSILDRYLESTSNDPDIALLKTRYALAFKNTIEFLELHLKDEQFNLAAMGTVGSLTIELQEPFNLLCRFLDETLSQSAEPIKFNRNIAEAAKAKIIDPQLALSDRVYFYDAPANLGIREKYSQGTLTAEHWLTELDLQRMLKLTGTESKITILPFTTTSIATALHLERQEHQNAKTPYSIALLLNRGSESPEQGAHWVSAIFSYNPIANTLSYQIDDSLAISPVQKEDYKRRIEAAIAFDDGFHKAYPFAQINEQDSYLKGTAVQRDGYSCGYRALHHIFQHPGIADGNEQAKTYAAVVPSSSADLVRAFYRQQLQDFRLAKEAFDILNPTARIAFDKPVVDTATMVGINEKRLEEFIAELPASRVSIPPTGLDPAVESFIGEYTPGKPLLRFPVAGKIASLNAIQYEALFEKLSEIDSLIQTPVPVFRLSHCDLAALDGLNAFYVKNKATVFEKLVIEVDLAADDRVSLYLSKLKYAFQNLSRTQLKQIEINDDKSKISEKHISEIIQFVRAEKVAIGIDLPKEYRNSHFQRQLDREIAMNRRQKNAELLGPQVATETLKSKSHKKSIRRRERIDLREAMKIDIELQEGVEESVVVEKVQKARRAETAYDAIKILRLNDLMKAVALNVALIRFDENPLTAKKEEIQKALNYIPGLLLHKDKLYFADKSGQVKELRTDNEDIASKLKSKFRGYYKLADTEALRLISPLLDEKISNDFSKFEVAAAGLSKKELLQFWHTIFANLTKGDVLFDREQRADRNPEKAVSQLSTQIVYYNQVLSGISEEALAKLIAAKDYYQNGINLLQLPQGFLLLADPDNPACKVLHYDSNMDVQNTIAPLIINRKAAQSISIDLVDSLLSGKESEKAYAKIWHNLRDATEYKREYTEIFRQYIASLMNLDDEQLAKIIHLCDGVEQFNYQKLAFIFENLAKAKSSYDKGYNEDSLVSVSWMAKIFPDFEQRKSYVELADSIKPVKVNHHPLLTELETAEERAILQSLRHAIEEYKLTDQQLNALLKLYDKYGVAGLDKILGTWQAITDLAIKAESVQADVAAYESSILNDTLLEAAKIISGFSPLQRQWWDKLYALHEPKADNLAQLVKNFKDFSQAIWDRGLQFYDLQAGDNLFTGSANLPTSLGRMLNILDLCKAEDKAAQWLSMSQINLSAIGAIRSMTTGVGAAKAYSFFVPEMQIDPQKDLIQGIDAVNNISIAAAKEDRLMCFYRYLAHQDYRLPLSFYQNAAKFLESCLADGSLPDKTVQQLYRILADSTTGDNCRYFIDDLVTAEHLWKGIVENIRAILLPTKDYTTEAKEQTINELSKLQVLPALPVLAKLVELTTKPLQKVGYTDIPALKKKLTKLEQANTKMRALVDKYGSKVYLGMKSYTDTDFNALGKKDTNLFEAYIAICKQLDEQGLADVLLPHISSFKLNLDSIAVLSQRFQSLNALDKNFEGYLFNYALDIVKNIENTDGLDSKKLEDVLLGLEASIRKERENFENNYNSLVEEIRALKEQEQEVPIATITRLNYLNALYMFLGQEVKPEPESFVVLKEIAESSILPLLKEQLEQNFAKNYFENLKAVKPQGQLKMVLDKSFKEADQRKKVESILVKYPVATEEEKLQLVSSINAICEDLSGTEKLSLLTLLNEEALLAAPLAQYNTLLGSIEKCGSSSFGYFMQAAKTRANLTGLAEKAACFLSDALETLRERDTELLEEMDLLPLAIDLILEAKEKEFEHEFDLDNKLNESINQLQSAINSKDERLPSILAAAKENHTAIAELEAIKSLEKHLEWLKQDELEEIEVFSEPEVAINKAQGTNEKKSFFQNIKDLFKNRNQTAADKKATPLLRQKVRQKKEKHTSPAILEAAASALKALAAKSNSYGSAFRATFALIDKLVVKFPAAKSLIVPFAHNFMQGIEADETLISKVYANLRLVHDELIAVADQDLLISLTEHFAKEGLEGRPYNYKVLLAIFQGRSIQAADATSIRFENYPKLEVFAKKQVLKVVTSLLNNDKPCSLEDIQTLINSCSDSHYVEVLEQLFNTAPYPTLDLITDWYRTETTQNELSVSDVVVAKYKDWNKNPVAREEMNGFILKDAKVQAKLMQGVAYTDNDLEVIDSEVKRVRQLSTHDLIQEIKDSKETCRDPSKLVALMAELLYRTKGLPQIGVGESREWGRSFEINTTQYLAIHSMLKSGGHVTSQIGTGEGKSRIMMIAIACQYALGKTVDFVTADLSLATRDYLEGQSLFKALGAETNIIYAHTPASEYRIGGINFSDASNLSLFRNKARSEGNALQVIDSEPAKRSLMLDEADKTYFDSSDTRYNYSAAADPAIRDMPWVYELFIEYFSDPLNVDLYYTDADQCNEKFYNFAKGKLQDHQMARLLPNPKIPVPQISRNQLEAWQSSALTAMQLRLNIDYIIKPNLTIQSKNGPIIVSQAQLLSGSRASGNAKFSFGVHQCLHARLNLLRQNSSSVKDSVEDSLRQELASVQHPFHIDSENQIVYSSTSKALLDDYTEGELLAVTGTAGSIKEKEEAAIQFGQNTKEMAFIDVPRHRGQKRQDLPVSLGKNEQQQYVKILASIKESLAKNPPQPILLVCENDTESQRLFEYLNSSLTTKEKEKLTRISARTRLSEEMEYVNKKAGQAGAITVSTAMLGRGTDIKLHKSVLMKKGKATNIETTSGLKVLGTYLPKERDYWQIVGRAGRFGALGESRLILNEAAIKKLVGTRVLPTEFYTATESYLKHLQKQMDSYAQQQRLIKDAVGDFRLLLTNQYFNEFYSPLSKIAGNQKDQLLESWQKFFDKTDKKWNDTWPKIVEKLAKVTVPVEEIKQLLQDYEESVKEEWKAMREYIEAQISTGAIICPECRTMLEKSLPLGHGAIHLSGKESFLSARNTDFKQETMRTVIAGKYDKAYVGRAVIYKRFIDGMKAFFKNIAAAWRGDGPWFPNLKAVRNGNMSWSQFLFGTWGSPLKEKTVIKAVSQNGTEKNTDKVMVPEKSSTGQMLNGPLVLGSQKGNPKQKVSTEKPVTNAKKDGKQVGEDEENNDSNIKGP